MMDGYIRVAAVSPSVRIADPSYHAAEAARLSAEAAAQGARVAVFPELCLTAYTCGDLFFHTALLREAEAALGAFIEATRELDILSVIGVPVARRGAVYNCAAVVKGGRLLGLVPKATLPRPDTFREGRYFAPAPSATEAVTFAGQSTLLGTRLLFACRELPSLVIAAELGCDLFAAVPPSVSHTAAGATLIACPAASPEGIGAAQARRLAVQAHTKRLITSYIYADAGIGESGTDAAFGAHRLIVSHGRIAAEAAPFATGSILTAELDTDRTLSERRKCAPPAPEAQDGYTVIEFSLTSTETEISCPPPRFPFVPENPTERDERCASILNIQARALAGRIERSRAKTAVLGVSGGLDSTLALLVAVRAADLLGRDRRTVTAVTMPCFGTTARTKGNAEHLAERLGVTLRCVDIQAAVAQHFRDIGQPEDRYDVVYENAQARERTQVLMDIANAEGGLVIGTGDLSELALGWATYNGDHMSMYAVNASVPKTLIRHIVAYAAACAEAQGETPIAAVLNDVLDTPVSPELLPPKDGEIAQCTEGIVGPYELHDYFLYYTLRYGFPPKKLLRLATASFRGVYDGDTVRAWLKVFLRRFATQQFKRSCLPDGPSVGSVSVSPRTTLSLPSDADPSAWFSV